MSALIIALVVLVLVAIGIVVRLLIAELAKPARPEVKTIRNVSYAPAGVAAPVGDVLVGAGVGAGVVGGMGAPGGVGLAEAGPSGTLAAPEAGLGTAVAAPVAVPRTRRQRRMRMRDVVERGEGVRISFWRRLRSMVSLFLLVSVLGLGAAAVIGGIVLLIAFVLEQAVN